MSIDYVIEHQYVYDTITIIYIYMNIFITQNKIDLCSHRNNKHYKPLF